jgi:hypothetical protein
MTDFAKELEGKAYLLVSGTIDLDEFKSWYQLAQAAKAGSVTAEAPEAQPEQAPFTPPPKVQRFDDYVRDTDEPSEDMKEHHKKLLGSGSEE